MNLNRESNDQRQIWKCPTSSECVVKIGYRPPSVHHYLMVTDCSEAALLQQISCADSIRNQDAPRVPQLSISQAPVSPRKDVWKCPPFNLAGFMGFDWCCQWGEIWLRDATMSNNANRVLAYIQSRLPADNKSVEKNPAPATIRSQCRKQFCYNCFGSNWQLNLHI